MEGRFCNNLQLGQVIVSRKVDKPPDVFWLATSTLAVSFPLVSWEVEVPTYPDLAIFYGKSLIGTETCFINLSKGRGNQTPTLWPSLTLVTSTSMKAGLPIMRTWPPLWTNQNIMRITNPLWSWLSYFSDTRNYSPLYNWRSWQSLKYWRCEGIEE